MTTDELRKLVADNLATAGFTAEDIRVQPEGRDRWRLAVISKNFDGLGLEERSNAALAGLDQDLLTWLDLLSPAELEWAGALPADVEVEDLPLWAESLAKASDAPTVFASDLDDDLPKPSIVTFYSLRGGVGRSTALVHAAKILASRGRKVVTVDMDLEAPGLASLFGVENLVRVEQGVVSLLTELDLGADKVDVSEHLIRVSSSDDLYCLPAGTPSASYARQLALLDPGAWYREDRNPLRLLMDALKSQLPFQADFILIDSRTGISPISGPLLFDLPDLAVVVFFPHPQAREGTRSLVQAIASAKAQRRVGGVQLTPEPRFIASPVPSGESFEKYERRANEWVGEWLAPINAQRGDKPTLMEADLTHVIPYREALANSDQVSRSAKDWSDFNPVADWIDRLAPADPTIQLQPAASATKDAALAELSFPTGTAESQTDLLDTFVETGSVRKALDPDVPLVRGRKGTGKTALFRQLTEGDGHPSIKVVAPQSLQNSMEWQWGADAYSEIDRALASAGADWQFFWSVYICLRVHSSGTAVPPPDALKDIMKEAPTSELDAVNQIEKILAVDRRELIVGDWLRRLDAAQASSTLLLFDGLDTGFGNAQPDRRRRIAATEGLFSFLIDRASQLKNLKLKIVLREDIWRQLRFENKSHLFGRDASLAWRDSEDFYRVILIHAIRSQAFKEILSLDKSFAGLIDIDVDLWSADAVNRAWILLIGERMKGSGTTYTKNWVWNRLADANDDRSPRYLLMLFNLVTEWERQENSRSRYERSVIRPRSLEARLPDVSKWALDALREEFEELGPVLTALTNERTPFQVELLQGVDSDLITLAQEVGLLSVYEERDGNPERYAVPEIYRHALGMKRRGQA